MPTHIRYADTLRYADTSAEKTCIKVFGHIYGMDTLRYADTYIRREDARGEGLANVFPFCF